MFKLDEPLEIGLRAVASRYPGSLVEINKEIHDRSGLWEGLWPVEQVLEHLHTHEPQVLHTPSRVLIDDGQAISAIYLLDRSQEVPALYLYSGHSAGGPYRQGLHEAIITLEGGDSDLISSQRRQQSSQEAAQEMSSTSSLALSFPLRAGKTQEWRAWIRELLGPRRSEYEAFSRKLGLKVQRAYLQHTPHGDQAIMYLEGPDLQRTFLQLQTSEDPFTVWVRQRIKDLFDGIDLTQTDLASLSQYVFEAHSTQAEEANDEIHREMESAASEARLESLVQEEERDEVLKEMQRLGMISP